MPSPSLIIHDDLPAPRADRLPLNPFVYPSADNTNLDFLAVDADHLPYAVEFYASRRRLREGIVLNFFKRKGPDAEADWAALVAEAAGRFEPRDWMLPITQLQDPALIKGIYDYVPISDTTPELYSPELRERMRDNGQQPWMICLTLNSRWHSPESFLQWVHATLVPEVVKSARTVALTHFHPAGAPDHDRPARRAPIRLRRAKAAENALSLPRLRERLLDLAAHRLRLCALPGESVQETYARYRAALPPGIDRDVTPEQFARRLSRIAAEARAEWLLHFSYEKRLRIARDRQLLHLLD